MHLGEIGALAAQAKRTTVMRLETARPLVLKWCVVCQRLGARVSSKTGMDGAFKVGFRPWIVREQLSK